VLRGEVGGRGRRGGATRGRGRRVVEHRTSMLSSRIDARPMQKA
jgi:hypothetical protein